MTIQQQRATDAHIDALKERIAGKVCQRCNAEPWIAFIEGANVARCNCFPDGPALVQRPSQVAIEQAKHYDRDVALGTEQAKAVAKESLRALCPLATDRELYVFQRLCMALNANPFIGEAHLVKYDKNSAAAFVPGYQLYLKRANRVKAYAGFESGVIVERDGIPVDLEGSVLGSSDKLIGGWAAVYRHDRKVATKERVQLTEFDKGQSSWKKMPAFMIEKVAIAHAFKRAFPDEMETIAQAMQTVPGEGVVIEDGDMRQPSEALAAHVDEATGEIVEGSDAELQAEYDKRDLFGGSNG